MVSECISDHRENSQSRGQGCSSLGKVFAWHAESLGLMPSMTNSPVTPTLGRPSLEDQKFKVIFGCMGWGWGVGSGK